MAVPTGTRLKREDFRRTKHDSVFSQWKILIGPSDWEDHSTAKPGAEKYRTRNLPNWASCPGVYELGVVASGRGPRKVDSSSVVPVYIGQADNLRTRMQQYGRDGNHLENGCLNNKWSTDCETGSSQNQKGVGLFTDIFSRGMPIVYRCAAVKSKKDAEITERQLLDKFDYAWNTVSNGARRQGDVYRKLEHMVKQSQFSLLASKFLFTRRKQVGVKIKTCRPSKDNGSNSSNTDDDNNNNNITIFSRIFRVKRLQPTRVQQSGSSGTDNTCGVAIGGGCVCTTPPVEGRKRCALHKGMRVNGYVSKPDAERKVVLPVVAALPDQNVVDLQGHHPFVPVCGFIMENGFPCAREPVPKNKRCLEHKGRRIIRKSQP